MKEQEYIQVYKKTPNFIFKICKNLCHGVCSLYFNYHAYNLHYIPQKGPFLLTVNHRSFLDPPLAGIALRENLYFFARKTLFKNKFWCWLFKHLNCIPVDVKSGGLNVTALKKVLQILDSGEPLVVFPEGTRSMDDAYLPAKAGIGMMACKTRVPVVPARIFGAYDAWPKQNSFPRFNHKITIVYGQPLMPGFYDPGKEDAQRYQHAADIILEAIKKIEIPSERLP